MLVNKTANMLPEDLVDSILYGEPYFGNAMWALQGLPIRHKHMQSLVRLLASRHDHKKSFNILEVGTWAGGSAITWAEGLRENCLMGVVDCIDVWAPYFDLKTNTLDVYHAMNFAAKEGLIYGLFLHNIQASGYKEIVRPIFGRSEEVLPKLFREKYVIVFLDGSHNYADVKRDILNSLDLIAIGGVICGDDLEMQEHMLDKSISDLNLLSEKEYVENSVASYHPGVTRAVSEVFGCVSSWDGFWAMQKTSSGEWAQIDLTCLDGKIPAHLSDCEISVQDTQKRQVLEGREASQIIKKIIDLESNLRVDSSIPLLLGSMGSWTFFYFKKQYYRVHKELNKVNWGLPTIFLRMKHSRREFHALGFLEAISLLSAFAIRGLSIEEEKIKDYIIRNSLNVKSPGNKGV